MSLSMIVLSFAAILLAALLLEPIAQKLRLPFSAVLVASGFFGSILIINAGYDTGLRWHHFHDLVFYVFLPVLIFKAAMHLDAGVLLKNLLHVIILSVPMLLLSTVFIASALFFGINHATGFPIITALIAGVILSATDPVAVAEISTRIPLSDRLLTLLEGESLFNDATTIVLFTLLIAIAMNPESVTSATQVTRSFLLLAFGGLLTGGITALLGWVMIRITKHHCIVSLIIAYGSYLIAEHVLQVSGVMASLSCGLVFRYAITRSQTSTTLLNNWWEQLGWIANSAVFLLVGVTITLSMFEERWLAMLIGIAAALVARFIAVWFGTSLTSLLPRQESVTRANRLVLWFGGARGAVTLALALSLPIDLPGWWTVQSVAYGVVLFSLFVQAPLLVPIIQTLKRHHKL